MDLIPGAKRHIFAALLTFGGDGMNIVYELI